MRTESVKSTLYLNESVRKSQNIEENKDSQNH